MGYDIVIYIIYALCKVTLPEWLTGSPAIQQSGWSLTASVRIAQVTFFYSAHQFKHRGTAKFIINRQLFH